jgi:hypothetical protein
VCEKKIRDLILLLVLREIWSYDLTGIQSKKPNWFGETSGGYESLLRANPDPDPFALEFGLSKNPNPQARIRIRAGSVATNYILPNFWRKFKNIL